MGPELAAVSGFTLKIADDLMDEFNEHRWALFCGLTSAAAALASVIQGTRPDLYWGLILGNAVAGKIDQVQHLMAAGIVGIGLLLVRPEVDLSLLIVITVLAALDELLHPMEPTGLRPVLKVGTVVLWALGTLDTITALAAIAFDLGYHSAEYVMGAVGCSNPTRA